jgi:hypothetical protein
MTEESTHEDPKRFTHGDIPDLQTVQVAAYAVFVKELMNLHPEGFKDYLLKFVDAASEIKKGAVPTIAGKGEVIWKTSEALIDLTIELEEARLAREASGEGNG